LILHTHAYTVDISGIHSLMKDPQNGARDAVLSIGIEQNPHALDVDISGIPEMCHGPSVSVAENAAHISGASQMKYVHKLSRPIDLAMQDRRLRTEDYYII
jgi:hypothetical protein